ncbi:hypothetical protein ACFL35_10585 [Candidatus Riflebacteria bacterium]
MSKQFVFVLIFSFFFLLNIAQLNSSETQTVIVSGSGLNQTSAIKVALKGAVEQAIGTLTDSETIIKNDEIISNKILSYSDGYVKKWEMIGTPRRSSDGLIHLKIKAIVKKDKLIQKMKEYGFIESKVDGKSLFAEAFTKIQRRVDGKQLFNNLFKNILTNQTLLRAQVISNRLVKGSDPAEIEVKVQITFDFNAYKKKFIPKLLKVFDAICKKKFDEYIYTNMHAKDPKSKNLVFRSAKGVEKFSKYIYQISTGPRDSILFFIDVRDSKSHFFKKWNVYLLKRDTYWDLINRFYIRAKDCSAIIQFMDKYNDIIASRQFYLSDNKKYIPLIYGYANFYYISNWMGGGRFGIWGPEGQAPYLGTCNFKIPLKKLNNITKIRCIIVNGERRF